MINQVFYNDILLHIFRQVSEFYRPCVMLTCKRWRDVIQKYAPNERPLYFHRLIECHLSEMTIPCARFLLELDNKRERRLGWSSLRQRVVETKQKELYDVLFFGKKQFFLPIDVFGARWIKQVEQIEYEMFCERFGIHPGEEDDEEFVPKKKLKNDQ